MTTEPGVVDALAQDALRLRDDDTRLQRLLELIAHQLRGSEPFLQLVDFSVDRACSPE